MSEEEVGNQSANEGSTEQSNGAVEKPAWLAQLPAQLKDNETFAGFKTIGDLGSKYLELEGKTKGYIKPLGKNATPEEVSEYRKAVGVPEKSSDYKIERLEKMPDGMVYDEVLESKFKEIAHKNNYTQQQVTELSKMHTEYMVNLHNEMVKDIKANEEKAVNTLKDIWKGDSFKENTEKSIRAFNTFLENSNPPKEFGGKEGVQKWVAEHGINVDPVMIWFFNKTFDLIGDDKFIKGSPGGGEKQSVEDKMFPSMANKQT